MRRLKPMLVAVTLAMMAAGILMVCQPWVRGLFQWGFVVILAGIVAFTIASHLPEGGKPHG